MRKVVGALLVALATLLALSGTTTLGAPPSTQRSRNPHPVTVFHG